MTVPLTPARSLVDRLDAIELELLAAFTGEPERVLDADELAEMCPGIDWFQLLPALARLAYDGHIQRVAPGRYRWPDDVPMAVAKQLRRECFGED